MTPTKQSKGELHIPFDTIDEAKREAYRTGSTWFSTFFEGKRTYSVRVKPTYQ